MKTYKRWSELKHKSSPEVRERIKREALEEYDRMGRGTSLRMTESFGRVAKR